MAATIVTLSATLQRASFIHPDRHPGIEPVNTSDVENAAVARQYENAAARIDDTPARYRVVRSVAAVSDEARSVGLAGVNGDESSVQ